MSTNNTKATTNTKAQETPTTAPVQEPVIQTAPAPTPEPAQSIMPTVNGLTADQQQVLIDIIRNMTPEQLMAFMATSQTAPMTAPMTAPTQEPTQAPATAEPTSAPTQSAVEYYEVVPNGTPVVVNNVSYNTEGGNKPMNGNNTKILDTRKNEFERDLNRAGLSKMEALDLIAKGRACGEFGTNDVLSIQKRADILRDFDRREQAHIDAQLRRAELEAKAKSNDKKNGLTTGQKVWIAVGVAAVVLIVGGAVWYLIQKKKNADAFAEDFAEETSARCDRIFAARGLAI